MGMKSTAGHRAGRGTRGDVVSAERVRATTRPDQYNTCASMGFGIDARPGLPPQPGSARAAMTTTTDRSKNMNQRPAATALQLRSEITTR